MRTLWVFRKNKCRSVYPLSINSLDLFLGRMKCRLFVGKIWEKTFVILHSPLLSNSMRFAMFCRAFYDEMHSILRSNRRRNIEEKFAFLYRTSCVSI